MNIKNDFLKVVFLVISCVFMTLETKQALGSAYIPRSQSLNGPRKIAGEIPGINTHVYMPQRKPWEEYDPFVLGPFPYLDKKMQSFFAITTEYQHSFWPSGITEALFGQSKPIAIQGSAVPGRNANAWLADNFYLPDTFKGILASNATIASFIMELNAYMSLDVLCSGLYCRIYTPFVCTKWGLKEKNNSAKKSSHTYSGGHITPGALESNQLLNSASAFFNGAQPPVISQPEAVLDSSDVSTIIRHPLRYGKISSHACSGTTRVGLAEIRGEFGYDFWQNDYSHAGLYLAGALPTGTRPNPTYIFTPTVGNGGQYEIGAGVTGHWIFWHTVKEDHQCGIFVDALVTHMCGSRKEYRAFDLKKNPMSRYMLAARHEKLDPPGGDHNLSGDKDSLDAVSTGIGGNPILPRFVQFNKPTNARYRYAGEVMPVANLTAQEVLVKTPVQIDATLWFNYSTENLSADFGYNLWVQTRTSTKSALCAQGTQKLVQEQWALVGASNLYGYFPSLAAYANQGEDIPQRTNVVLPAAHGKAIALGASQSKATLRTSNTTYPDNPNAHSDNAENFAYAQTDPIAWPTVYTVPPRAPFSPTFGEIIIPPGVDGIPFSPLVNFSSKDVTTELNDVEDKGALGESFIHLSMDPLFITPTDIDRAIASSTLSVSHTLFATIGYTWSHENWEPYLGFGSSIEFGSSGSNCRSGCSANRALSQWGLWAKCAFIFN